MLNSDLNGWNVLRLEYYFFWFLISFYGKVGLTISFRPDKIAKNSFEWMKYFEINFYITLQEKIIERRYRVSIDDRIIFE